MKCNCKHYISLEVNSQTIRLQFFLMRWGKWEDRKPQLANEIHPKGIGVGLTSQQGSQEDEGSVLLFNVRSCDVQLHHSQTTASANVWICSFHLITLIQIISRSKRRHIIKPENSSWPIEVWYKGPVTVKRRIETDRINTLPYIFCWHCFDWEMRSQVKLMCF